MMSSPASGDWPVRSASATRGRSTPTRPAFCWSAWARRPALSDLLAEEGKEYQAVLALGRTTTTEDASGDTLTDADASHVTEEQLRELLPRFTGLIQQVPPMVSAVHHQGQRLYELARQGVTVERAARPVQIDALTLRGLHARRAPDGNARRCLRQGDVHPHPLRRPRRGPGGGGAHGDAAPHPRRRVPGFGGRPAGHTDRNQPRRLSCPARVGAGPSAGPGRSRRCGARGCVAGPLPADRAGETRPSSASWTQTANCWAWPALRRAVCTRSRCFGRTECETKCL